METPFYLRPYPIPYIYREAAKSQIAEMLNWGVIEIANTEYINFLVVVKKKGWWYSGMFSREVSQFADDKRSRNSTQSG